MLPIAIINGPNLNLLGTRETDIYGQESFDNFFPKLQYQFPEVSLTYFQSNVEGLLIDYIQECRKAAGAIVLNAGAYTHTSIAIADALAAVGLPAVEVHISNVYAREDYRRSSFIAAKCIGAITGLGLDGYAFAVQFLVGRLQALPA